MKNVITVLLSIFITLILMILGVSYCAKNIITKTTTLIIKEEITNKIVETSDENTNLNKEEIKEKVEEVLNKNPKINDFVSSSFDKLMGVLNDEIQISNIDFESEVSDLLETIDPILNEYGITITDEMKDEIMSYVRTDEANNLITKTVEEIKTSIPENMEVLVVSFTNLVSMKFKMMLVSLIIVFLVIIAFLKKSYYKWTINLSIPSLIVGLFFILGSSLINIILKGENLSIDFNNLNTYGYINIGLGVLLLIVYIVLNIILKNKNIDKPADEVVA